MKSEIRKWKLHRGNIHSGADRGNVQGSYWKGARQEKYFSADELLRIPQALRDKDKTVYQRILKKHFGAQCVKDSENAMLDEIMKLKPKHIITTNFDTLIEMYLQDKEDALYKSHSAKEGYAKLVRRQIPYHYARVVKDGDMVSADANHLLLKIHVDVQNMDFLVLCEDDYLAYSDSHILSRSRSGCWNLESCRSPAGGRRQRNLRISEEKNF